MNTLSHPSCLSQWRKEKNTVKFIVMFAFICFGVVSAHPKSLSAHESFSAVAVKDRTLHGQRVDKVRTFSILQEL
jgi:hypothetical protein